MTVYWILFGLFAIGALVAQSRLAPAPVSSAAAYPAPFAPVQFPPPHPQAEGRHRRPATPDKSTGNFLLGAAAAVPVLLIGLRDAVGTDFGAYKYMYTEISRRPLNFALTRVDPGYGLLNYWFGHMGLPFWAINLVCGVIFMYGIVRFAQSQANPWLAVAVSVPYLIIVVGMGYSRQAVAIGLSMAGFVALKNGSNLRFIVYVLFGGLFHRSVVVLIPIVTLSQTRNRLAAAAILVLGLIIGYYLLESGQGLEHFQASYLRVRYESKGAGIRLALNLAPALIFLATQRRFNLTDTERATWRNMAIVAVLSFAIWPFFPSSAALDRLALYIIPLQIFVLSRLPAAFSGGTSPSLGLTSLILIYSAAIEWVWLGMSDNGINWLPYKMVSLF